MRRIGRWLALFGFAALMTGVLVVVGYVGLGLHASRGISPAERAAQAREAQERYEKEMAEATRGVPYVMSWPFGPLSRKPHGFQIAVQGDQVGFHQPIPGLKHSPDVWFIYLTIQYNDPLDPRAPVDTSWRLRIDETNLDPFRIERGEHAFQDELLLRSVSYPNGEHSRFHCNFAGAPDGFREAKSAADLTRVDPGLNISCRTFIPIRWGVRLMVQFPINKADTAHRAVTRAVALMDRSILDQPPPEN